MECNFKSRLLVFFLTLSSAGSAIAQDATPELRVNTDAWHAITSASPIVQITLLILVILSVMTWAVGWSKYKQFNALTSVDELFLKRFWKASSLDNVYEDLDTYAGSSVSNVFRSGYEEMQRLAEANGPGTDDKAEAPKLQGIDNLERSLRKAVDHEIARMESRLGILATTGSTSPFIGLFGTVWGIMGSFQKIGATGSASLAVVAPGIAEALIATAVGLGAAIPAVMLYNHFIGKVRKQEIELSSFSTDFLNVVKRNFFRE